MVGGLLEKNSGLTRIKNKKKTEDCFCPIAKKNGFSRTSGNQIAGWGSVTVSEANTDKLGPPVRTTGAFLTREKGEFRNLGWRGGSPNNNPGGRARKNRVGAREQPHRIHKHRGRLGRPWAGRNQYFVSPNRRGKVCSGHKGRFRREGGKLSVWTGGTVVTPDFRVARSIDR